jgi:phosphatidylglycerol:prolipoprotein diacylglycerol transferase
MIPVLFRFTFNTGLSQGLLYLFAVAVIAYVAWTGWRSAEGAYDPKRKVHAEPPVADRATRAAMFGGIAAVVAYFGLPYALPPSAPFLGGKGLGIPIHTYGLLLISGFILASNICATMAEKEWLGERSLKMREFVQDKVTMAALVGGIAGSRILFVIVNWKEQGLSGLFSLDGGLVFYGGLMGAIGLCYAMARYQGIDFLRLSDVAIPTVSLGQCLGRLGCFSAGCCWGDPTRAGFPLGVNFPGSTTAKNILGQLSHTASLIFQSQTEDKRYIVEATGQVVHQAMPGAVRISDWVMSHGHSLPVHPTQLYESLGQLGLFVALVVMRRYRRFHGQIIGVWLMSYAVLRSTIELFRGDLERGTLHGLLESVGSGLADSIRPEAWYNVSTSQFISLCMFALGATILYRQGRTVWGQNDGAGAVPAQA